MEAFVVLTINALPTSSPSPSTSPSSSLSSCIRAADWNNVKILTGVEEGRTEQWRGVREGGRKWSRRIE